MAEVGVLDGDHRSDSGEGGGSGSAGRVSATAGWTFSNGVEADSSLMVPGVGTFNTIDPKDAFSWGLRLGFFAGENSEIGFLFNQQPTQIDVRGTTTIKIGDVKINNYHGYYAYNFGEGDADVRPYLLFGLGATQYGKVTATVSGTPQDIPGESRFSGTGAFGVKVYPGENVGILLRNSLDTDLYHDDYDGLVVRPLLGLLPCREFQVLAPVRAGRRHLVPILTRVDETADGHSGSRTCHRAARRRQRPSVDRYGSSHLASTGERRLPS